MAPFAEQQRRQRMNMKDRIGSAMLKLTGREQQYLWREALQHAALTHGMDLPAWHDNWDLPKVR
jgi:hypothetical protein